MQRDNRPAKKLIQSFKWLSHEKRYDIWQDTRLAMRDHQIKYQENNETIIAKIAIEVNARLSELCISEKGQEACIERYTYHLK